MRENANYFVIVLSNVLCYNSKCIYARTSIYEILLVATEAVWQSVY